MRLNTTIFIERSTKIHGNLYDYSLVQYIKNSINVKILCKKHGVFDQRPANHLNGAGCLLCSREEHAKQQTYTKEKFIEKAIAVHNKKYEYLKVVYKGTKIKVIITCREHGDFKQTPSDHLMGKGCKKCAVKNSTRTLDQFIKLANEKHNNKFDYSKFVYVKNEVKGIIICPIHGEFLQTPASHLAGKGCLSCAPTTRANTMFDKYGVYHSNHVPEFFDKLQNSIKKSQYRSKPYTLPSGKIILLQGYEDKGLTEVLTKYKESEILFRKKDMPEIWYEFENKKKKILP